MDLYFIIFIYLIISGLIGKFIFLYTFNFINKSLKDKVYISFIELIFICFLQISIITLILMYIPK